MKKLLSLLALGGMVFGFTACSEDDDPVGKTTQELQEEAIAVVATAVETATAGAVNTSASGISAGTNFDWVDGIDVSTMTGTEEEVTANITTDTEWTNDNIYILKGRITIESGATLTIQEGTLIKGDKNLTGPNAAVLMVARGGKLMAEGTADKPIVMTSTADNGTLSASDKGKWGGLVVLGKAPISSKNGGETQIEGVPATDANGLYGGNTAADNSGVIQYVSIRHGGAVIDAAAGDEINGLTLGGVGSGTTIDHLEIFANSDDGVEFFGGAVNVNYVKVSQVGDDGLDVDQSYAGTVTNFMITVDGDSDEGLEIDGREGDLDDTFTLKNGTIEAVDGASISCDFKSKAKGSVSNLNANGGKIKLSASFDTETLEEKEDAAMNAVDGSLTFSNVNATFEMYTKSFEE